MRIAYLVNQYPMASLTFIRAEIHALEALGHEVHRFALQPWGEELVDERDRREAQATRYAKVAGVRRLLLEMLRTAGLRPRAFLRALRMTWRVARRSDRSMARHLAYLAEACVIVQWLNDSSVDHLHAHFASNSAEVAMLTKALGGPPYSFMVHGPEDFDRAVCLSLDLKVANAEFVTTISSFARSQLFRWIAAEDWPKVKIVRCGIGADLLEAEIVEVSSSSRLVNIGRLNEQKGQLVLIEAAALVAASGRSFELDIIGDGDMRPVLEAAIEHHGLRGTVRLAGWGTNEQVRESLLASRAMVLASFAEGLPVVIMEAFALSRPVISTRIAGVPELVDHRVSGWLVTPGDARALADAIIEALDASPDVLLRMGTAGRQAVHERHDAGVEAKRLESLMLEVALRNDGSNRSSHVHESGTAAKLPSNADIV